MCQDSVAQDGFGEVEERLSKSIAEMSALEELDAWLRTQPCIVAVTLQDYLIKTHPPQREFLLEFRMDDRSTRSKVLNVDVLPGQTLKLRQLRDP